MRERVIEKDTKRESEKREKQRHRKILLANGGLLTKRYNCAEKIEFTKYNIIRK